ncbi:MAG TPA: LacI family DNA-binding transcriptional regulator [Anaerolineae bacterium]|nr:LacI family DNA-binding transcriptional regulator [Anaerolineae bacterium]
MSQVTIRDVAKRADVSIATVSRVLNNSSAVRPTTRESVMRAIRELDYRPNLTARMLSLGCSLSIGIILPFLTLPSFIERLRGIQLVLADSEYEMLLVSAESPERVDGCIENLLLRQVDGAIIISMRPADEHVPLFRQGGTPTVLIDAEHPQLDSVLVDDIDGGLKATNHLIELGHRHIAFLSDYLASPFNFASMQRRFDGYRKALAGAGIAFRADYHVQGNLGGREAYQKAISLLELADRPTAIFSASDTHAVGVLKAAHDLGIRVPEELSVVGYDDIRDAEYLHLTTVRQHLFESGVEGANLLLSGLGEPNRQPVDVRLPVTLVERGTTAPRSI